MDGSYDRAETSSECEQVEIFSQQWWGLIDACPDKHNMTLKRTMTTLVRTFALNSHGYRISALVVQFVLLLSLME